VETDDDWELAEPIDSDRVTYVNTAPGMGSRIREDARLRAQSAETVRRYERFDTQAAAVHGSCMDRTCSACARVHVHT